LDHEFRVATMDETVIGFVVMRRVAADEAEILNLAVAREFRRKRVAEGLFREAMEHFRGTVGRPDRNKPCAVSGEDTTALRLRRQPAWQVTESTRRRTDGRRSAACCHDAPG